MDVTGPIYHSEGHQGQDEVSSLWNPNSVALLYESSSTCALQCEADEGASIPTPFKFKTGQNYVYDYQVTTATLMKGTSDQESTAQIKATVQIQVESACDYHLKVFYHFIISLLPCGCFTYRNVLLKREFFIQVRDARSQPSLNI